MTGFRRGAVIVAGFLAFAGLGLAISCSAPYQANGDDLVYLIGALQARDGNFPDATMLAAYDFGTYVVPKVLLAWYEPLGYPLFQSIALVVLVVATGLSAYALYRRVGVPWVPSLLLSLVTLVPREAAGTEIFGILTFREAIGRALAVPVFFIATAALIRRAADGRPAWPVFGAVGLLMLLHPSTVMVFAGVSIVAVAAVRVFQRMPLRRVLWDTILSGVAFVVGGGYFFVEVLERLSRGVTASGVATADYVAAILFRNAWEFPAETILRYRHMAVVSAALLVLLIAGAAAPRLRQLRARHPVPQAGQITTFGVAMMAASLLLAIGLPAINLYLMEHADWPYVFQQWSRASKFFYLGLFVALSPIVSSLWLWYRSGTHGFRHALLALLFTAGLASSSFGFEIVQFAVGYPNFEASYIPQRISRVPDDITPEEYRETCRALESLGGAAQPSVVSDDFAFRYYCRADLYTTEEEGAAYGQLSRAEMVAWHAMVKAQTAALETGDPSTIGEFARRVGARFVVVPRTPRYAAFEGPTGDRAATTTRHIVVRVD